jgi:uncharacterized membrane protein
MSDVAFLITGLAVCTFALRIGGYYLGASLPKGGAWARAFNALPGTLIASLVAMLALRGGPHEWLAALACLALALSTRSLPATMAGGIAAIWALRHWG